MDLTQEPKKLYEPGEKVYYVRRCSEQTALMSPVEIGEIIGYMPGWTLMPHLRISPTPGIPAEELRLTDTLSVPQDRVWKFGPDGRKEAEKFVEAIRDRQKLSYARLQEKLEASKWKLKQIEKILSEIPAC